MAENYRALNSCLMLKLCIWIGIKLLVQFNVINSNGKLTKGHFSSELKRSQKD